MNAEEARKLTGESLQGPAIKPFVKALDRKIKTAAEQGKRSIYPHLSISELRMKGPTNKMWEAIRKHYESEGFRWEAHPTPILDTLAHDPTQPSPGKTNMKVFIDYDKQNEVYVATSADGTLTASSASDMFVKLWFVRAAKAAGHSGHAGDYNFVLRTSKLSHEGDKAVDLDDFWGGANAARIRRRAKILKLAEAGIDLKVIASKFDVPLRYVERLVEQS